MRGFRGSRSVQNQWSARFGRQDDHSNPQNETHSTDHPHVQNQRPQLPEWLKTPETRAREAAEAAEAQQQKPLYTQPKLPIQLPKTVQQHSHQTTRQSTQRQKPALKVVSSHSDPITTKQTKAKKPVKKKTTTSSTSTKTRTKTASKRKAA